MKKSDFSVVMVLYLITIAFAVMTSDLPAEAQTYPLVLIVSLGVLTTLYALFAIVRYRQSHQIENDLAVAFHQFIPKQFFVVFLLCCLYLALLSTVGYYISSILYLVLSMFFLRVKPLYTFLSVAVLMGVIYVVFTLFLKVPLPAGVFFN